MNSKVTHTSHQSLNHTEKIMSIILSLILLEPSRISLPHISSLLPHNNILVFLPPIVSILILLILFCLSNLMPFVLLYLITWKNPICLLSIYLVSYNSLLVELLCRMDDRNS